MLEPLTMVALTSTHTQPKNSIAVTGGLRVTICGLMRHVYAVPAPPTNTFHWHLGSANTERAAHVG
jgi:hypothetical protein